MSKKVLNPDNIYKFDDLLYLNLDEILDIKKIRKDRRDMGFGITTLTSGELTFGMKHVDKVNQLSDALEKRG